MVRGRAAGVGSIQPRLSEVWRIVCRWLRPGRSRERRRCCQGRPGPRGAAADEWPCQPDVSRTPTGAEGRRCTVTAARARLTQRDGPATGGGATGGNASSCGPRSAAASLKSWRRKALRSIRALRCFASSHRSSGTQVHVPAAGAAARAAQSPSKSGPSGPIRLKAVHQRDAGDRPNPGAAGAVDVDNAADSSWGRPAPRSSTPGTNGCSSCEGCRHRRWTSHSRADRRGTLRVARRDRTRDAIRWHQGLARRTSSRRVPTTSTRICRQRPPKEGHP
jgi:hypothetical protein